MIGTVQFSDGLNHIYGNLERDIQYQQKRYRTLQAAFLRRFQDSEAQRHYFSTPGRTEIGGNHTDHNHGRVLAASIHLDSIAVASPSHDLRAVLYSDGYEKPFVVDLKNLDVVASERGTTSALIRGIAAGFKRSGFRIGGFCACMTSDVLPGSGLSSSASVEVLIGSIFNALYNDNAVPAEIVAQVGQFSENEYFGKPCGLMDQTSCAMGGIIAIDFLDPVQPRIRKVHFDLDRYDYSLIVVDTGGNHADLTEDYASIPTEMKNIAGQMGKKVLRDASLREMMERIPDLRKKLGDRSLLRALHFYRENDRVSDQVAALESGDFQGFLNHVRASGDSSFKWLQNIYSANRATEQGVTLALALSDQYIARIGAGACRVHGGGFAGTIQVFLPKDAVDEYTKSITAVFGENSVLPLKIRSVGTAHLNSIFL